MSIVSPDEETKDERRVFLGQRGRRGGIRDLLLLPYIASYLLVTTTGGDKDPGASLHYRAGLTMAVPEVGLRGTECPEDEADM